MTLFLLLFLLSFFSLASCLMASLMSAAEGLATLAGFGSGRGRGEEPRGPDPGGATGAAEQRGAAGIEGAK